MCIISKPSVNWNWSYFLETLNCCNNWRFLSRVTLKFDGWPWKTIRHPPCATSSSVHHFIVICEFKLELRSENSLIWFWLQWPWPLTADFAYCMDITFVKGNNSWIQESISIRQCNYLHIQIVESGLAKANIRYRGAVIRNHVLSCGIDPDISEAVFVKFVKNVFANDVQNM